MKRHVLFPRGAIALGCALTTAVVPGADLVLTLDPAQARAEFEGIGAVSAGASSRLLIDYPEPARDVPPALPRDLRRLCAQGHAALPQRYGRQS